MGTSCVCVYQCVLDHMQRTEVHVYTRLASLELPQHTYTQYSLATEQLDQLLVAGLSVELDHILDVSP